MLNDTWLSAGFRYYRCLHSPSSLETSDPHTESCSGWPLHISISVVKSMAPPVPILVQIPPLFSETPFLGLQKTLQPAALPQQGD